MSIAKVTPTLAERLSEEAKPKQDRRGTDTMSLHWESPPLSDKNKEDKHTENTPTDSTADSDTASAKTRAQRSQKFSQETV